RLLIGGAQAVSALDARGPATVREALRLPADTTIKRLGDGWFARARRKHEYANALRASRL
ncbi:MAG: hypothetical protein ACE5I3_10225, partial [Phycisphaerae bacterium]